MNWIEYLEQGDKAWLSIDKGCSRQLDERNPEFHPDAEQTEGNKRLPRSHWSPDGSGWKQKNNSNCWGNLFWYFISPMSHRGSKPITCRFQLFYILHILQSICFKTLFTFYLSSEVILVWLGHSRQVRKSNKKFDNICVIKALSSQ